MNWRQRAYFGYVRARGHHLGHHYREYLALDRQPGAGALTRASLARLLDHCRRTVPHYREIIPASAPLSDPMDALQRMPLLTKSVIRSAGDRLLSTESAPGRYWNSSGGSTGEPVRLLQDREYLDRSGATSLLYSHWIGRDLGEPEIRLWGSERDILAGAGDWRTRLANWLTRTDYVNAFRMTPQVLDRFIALVNQRRPRLVVAYAQAMFEAAQFVLRRALRVTPPGAIVTSAGTLFAHVRASIEQAFGCRVYNRYGSREVGDIACERPGWDGLYVAPWGCYVEILDESGRRVQDGTEGAIVVTSLLNYSMPLVRYVIGDRGALRPAGDGPQILAKVTGRTVDTFVTRDGTMVDGEYFTHLLYFKPWVTRFQFVQRDVRRIVLRVEPDRTVPLPGDAELADLEMKVRAVMGPDCHLEVEFVDDLAPSPSGKFRYTISEIARDGHEPPGD